MLFETTRLRIRQANVDDLGVMHALRMDPEVMRYSKHGPNTLEQSKEFLNEFCIQSYAKYGFGHWMVEHKEDNKVVGCAGLAVFNVDGRNEIEIGFRLSKAYWNQGLGTELSMGIRDYAFNKLAIRRLIAIIEAQNAQSVRVAEKLGMNYEKDSVMFNKAVRIYSLSKY